MKNIKLKYYNLVKYFKLLINKILLKQQTKIKYFRFLYNKILLKQQTKTNKFFSNKSEFKISNFNKYLIVFISIIFLFLFYCLIPTLYDKNWIQNTLEKKLLKDFNVNFSLSSDISYEILPSPHFTIKNAKIINEDNPKLRELAEIEKFKIFISKKKLFNKKNLKINSISINNANFYIQKNDLNFFNNILSNSFLLKKIRIKKSNIFIENNENETISIIKIPEGKLFHDKLNLMNVLDLKGEVFNTPFLLTFNKNLSLLKFNEINIDLKKIDLNFFNKSSKNFQNITEGLNTFTILNSKLVTKYQFNKDVLNFNSTKSRIKQSNINYKGKISLNPFDLVLDINLESLKLSELIDPNGIFLEFFKNKIFFNKKLSVKSTLQSSNIKDSDIFDKIKITFNMKNGKVDFNNTVLIKDNVGMLKIINSNLHFVNDRLILTSQINVELTNLKKFYSILQTPKEYRKEIDNIVINFNYDFLDNKTNIGSFKINNTATNDEVESILGYFNSQKKNNFIKTIIFINKLFEVYSG